MVSVVAGPELYIEEGANFVERTASKLTGNIPELRKEFKMVPTLTVSSYALRKTAANVSLVTDFPSSES